MTIPRGLSDHGIIGYLPAGLKGNIMRLRPPPSFDRWRRFEFREYLWAVLAQSGLGTWLRSQVACKCSSTQGCKPS